jgi:hypothetical protein
MIDDSSVSVVGHCVVSDDLGNIILDKKNAIHSQNFARVLARALSNEQNFCIDRIAFGNGGSFVDVTQTSYLNPVNDGLYPDLSGYKSRLYNQTYFEYIDENSIKIGTGPASSPQDDPDSHPNELSGPGVVSRELFDSNANRWYSRVAITCVLNKNEPAGQYVTDLNGSTDSTDNAFEFDEIALFSGGVESDIPTSGYQTVTFGSANVYVKTGLEINKNYDFTINVDGEETTYQILTVPEYETDTDISFKHLVQLLNDNLKNCSVYMNMGDSSHGMLYSDMVFKSRSAGSKSTITIKNDQKNDLWLFGNTILPPLINDSISGVNSGAQNDLNNPSSELSRMLTHLIFEPIRKPMNRAYIVRYDLNIRINFPNE